LLAAAMSLYVATAAAQIYESRDSQGRRTYSDRPTSGATRRADIENTPRAIPQAVEQANQSLEQLKQAVAARQEKDHARKQDEDAQRLVAADLEQKCRNARSSYATIMDARRPYKLGQDGAREYLSSAQISAAMAAAQQAITAFCSKQRGR
jgi:hypothetical protein